MEFVKGITSDHELINLAKQLGIHLDGIFSIQEIKKTLPKKGSYLILLRAESGIGHWVCAHDNEYFDSTGVGPPRVLGSLRYNEFQYQSTYAEFCGVWSILWLYSKQKNKPELMKGFINLDVDVLS